MLNQIILINSNQKVTNIAKDTDQPKKPSHCNIIYNNNEYRWFKDNLNSVRYTCVHKSSVSCPGSLTLKKDLKEVTYDSKTHCNHSIT